MTQEDKRMRTQALAMNLVTMERARQIAKWGDQSGNTKMEWLGILVEEVGELAEAVNETVFQNAKHPERGGRNNIINEAVHVAAVAVAIVEAMLKEKQEVFGVTARLMMVDEIQGGGE